jgi:hypothetical protein
MADEQQYYNPIIQSMIAAQQGNMQRAKLQQEAEQFKADKLIREHQLGIEETRAKNEHEHQTGMLDVQKALAEAQVEANRLNRIKTARELALGGVDINQALPSMGGQQIQGIPSTQDLQAQEIQRIQREAGAQATGQMAAAEPFQIRSEERALATKQSLMDAENAFKERLADKEIGSKEALAKLERGTQLAIANATNATHLKVAGMQYTPTPEALRGMLIAGATGATKLNYANPQERAALGTLQEMGGREIDPKEAQALREGQQLIPLFDKLKTFADKLPTTKAGAFVQGHALGAANAVGWSTDTQNELNKLTSQALVVGRAVEGLTGGRVLSKQLELDLNSLASGAITKDQAYERLNNLKDLYTNKQENMIMGGLPDWQKDLVRKTYGIKSVSPSSTTAQPALGYTNIHVSPDGKTRIGQKDGKWYNTATDQEIK